MIGCFSGNSGFGSRLRSMPGDLQACFIAMGCKCCNMLSKKIGDQPNAISLWPLYNKYERNSAFQTTGYHQINQTMTPSFHHISWTLQWGCQFRDLQNASKTVPKPTQKMTYEITSTVFKTLFHTLQSAHEQVGWLFPYLWLSLIINIFLYTSQHILVRHHSPQRTGFFQWRRSLLRSAWFPDVGEYQTFWVPERNIRQRYNANQCKLTSKLVIQPSNLPFRLRGASEDARSGCSVSKHMGVDTRLKRC